MSRPSARASASAAAAAAIECARAVPDENVADFAFFSVEELEADACCAAPGAAPGAVPGAAPGGTSTTSDDGETTATVRAARRAGRRGRGLGHGRGLLSAGRAGDGVGCLFVCRVPTVRVSCLTDVP